MYSTAILIITLIVIASVITAIFLRITVDVGYNMDDEGYLWYGVLQTRAGKIPIRDFRAYDPGRYYWYALWSVFLGRSLIALRISSYLFGIMALTASGYLIFFATSSWLIAISGMILLIFWIQPVHKAIDCYIPLITIFLFALTLQYGGYTFWFLAMAWIAFTWFFGINHFLYNSIAGLFLILIQILCDRGTISTTDVPYVILGYFVGLLPMLIFLLVPGVANIYLIRKILPIIRRKTSNLKLPIPKPFSRFKSNSSLFSLRIMMIESLTLLVPISYIGWILFSLIYPENTISVILLSCSSVGIFYLNHYFSRADIHHLSQSIGPFVIGLCCLIGSDHFGILATIFLVVISYIIILQPWYSKIRNQKYGVSTEQINVGPSRIWTSKHQAQQFKAVTELIDANSSSDQDIFVAPLMVGLYPALQRQVPHYDSYPIYPSTPQAQAQMINEINTMEVQLAFIQSVPIDGRDELRFENTYPLIWDFFNSNYSKLDKVETLPDHFHFFIRK